MIDQLETILLKRNGQLEELQNRILELEYEAVSLKTKDVLRQAEYQALIATMQAGYAEASATYSVDTEAMELMNEEMMKAESRLAIVQRNSGKVWKYGGGRLTKRMKRMVKNE